jgi:hypothetical protein
VSKVNTQDKSAVRPSYNYPPWAQQRSGDTALLEMAESTRNAVEEGNRLAAENRDLLRQLLAEARGCHEELRRLRVVAEREDRRRLKERLEKKAMPELRMVQERRRADLPQPLRRLRRDAGRALRPRAAARAGRRQAPRAVALRAGVGRQPRAPRPRGRLEAGDLRPRVARRRRPGGCSSRGITGRSGRSFSAKTSRPTRSPRRRRSRS